MRFLGVSSVAFFPRVGFDRLSKLFLHIAPRAWEAQHRAAALDHPDSRDEVGGAASPATGNLGRSNPGWHSQRCSFSRELRLPLRAPPAPPAGLCSAHPPALARLSEAGLAQIPLGKGWSPTGAGMGELVMSRIDYFIKSDP